MKKWLLFLLTISIISCNTSKPVVRTTKAGNAQKTHAVVRTNTKTTTKNQTAASKTKAPVKQSTSIATKPKTEIKKAETVQPKTIAQEENTTENKTNTTTIDTTDEKPILIEATSKVKVTPAMVLAYINQYKEIAKSSMFEYGIPASITLAQGILESGTGQGALSVGANNHFGIKCNSDWTGESVRYNDDAENECFRKYEYPSQSYRDHSLFLSSKPRYASLFELEKDDYKEWAKGLRAAGYATDPDYPNKLIKLIERFQLQKYDSEVLGKEFNIENNNIAFNNIQTHQVSQGDTLYSISKKYNISIEELKKKNNINENGIAIGQSLIIR